LHAAISVPFDRLRRYCVLSGWSDTIGDLMTSEGAPAGVLNRNFDHVVRGGDLRMALVAAKDLPTTSLDHAVQLRHLMAKQRSRLYEPASRRWISRYAVQASPTPDQLAQAGEALAEMLHDPTSAEVLIRLCGGRTDLD
jgi:hypothetical protein